MSIPDKPSQAEGEDPDTAPTGDTDDVQADPEDKPSQAEG
jgi:hypothetical protein